MAMDMIPGCDSRLSLNFNHLMHANDLILVTKASRLVARNCSLCLSIYAHLTSQFSTSAKLAVYFPSWINWKLAKSISSIMNFKIGSFPLTYLRVLIAPRRIKSSQFQPLLNRISHNTAFWNNSFLSRAGKLILVNSSILAFPNYYLGTYSLPNCILNSISKLARDFLWSNSGNGSGFHLVGWNVATLGKPEGGLGIRDLKLTRIALMAKNVMCFLNAKEVIWVELAKLKYRDSQDWLLKPPANYSWFFRSLCKMAEVINTNLWIRKINPQATSFLTDPWAFDISLALKPTFMNMYLDIDNFQILDMTDNGKWDQNNLQFMFGPNFNSPITEKGIIDPNNANVLVWYPPSNSIRLSYSVYNFLNERNMESYCWDGWQKLWKLSVAPRVKFIIWLLLHGMT